MIHVQMCEQDVQLDGQIVLHRHAERPHSGPGVEDKHMTAVEAHLDTRRIAAVLDGIGTRHRDRPSTSPHAGAHQ